jgi:hypothetical protein
MCLEVYFSLDTETFAEMRYLVPFKLLFDQMWIRFKVYNSDVRVTVHEDLNSFRATIKYIDKIETFKKNCLHVKCQNCDTECW